jgi:hypothetical protein
MHARAQRFCALAFALALAGCSSIGPPTIKRDRNDYSNAMGNSWKEMQLLNIVKYRYFDPPVFLDVPSVVSQQEIEARTRAEAQFFDHELTNVSGTQNFGFIRAEGRYTDRPTISYTPITGQALVDLLLRPVPQATIFAMIDAGYPSDFIMVRTIKAMNDIYNYSLTATRAHPEDPRFPTLIAAIHRLQQVGAIAARTTRGDGESSRTTLGAEAEGRSSGAAAENKPLVTTLYFRRHVNAAAERDIRLVKSLLGLNPQHDEFRVTGGPRHTPEEIAVDPRSLQEVLEEFAAGVDVPEGEVADGRATGVPAFAASPNSAPLIHIYCADGPPDDAFSAVYYQQHWFWVENDDLRSKLDFLFLMIFSALVESRSIPQIPLVTISAGR